MVVRAAPKKTSGFVYKARTADQIKSRANRKGNKFDSIFKSGFDDYRPQSGDNCYRPLPPTWDDPDHYGFTIFVHSQIGADNSTYLCPRKMLGKPCPVCEAAKEAKDAKEDDEAKALKVSERLVSWVLDREGDDPEKPLLHSQSWTQDRDVAALCTNERTGETLYIDHPDNGYDVSFKKTGSGLNTKYYGWQIARSSSPIHDKQKVQDEILDYIAENPVPECLNYYDYEYLRGVLTGAVATPDAEAEAEVGGDEPPFEVTTRPAKYSQPQERVQQPAGRRQIVQVDDPNENEEADPETPSRPHGGPAEAPHDDDVSVRHTRRLAAEPPVVRRRVIEEDEPAPRPRTTRR